MGSYDTDRFSEATISDFLGGPLTARPDRNVRGLTIDELAPAERMRRRAGAKPPETLRQRLQREHDEAEEAILILAGHAVKRQRQLEHLGRYPAEDPFKDGTKLEFEKRYPGSDTRYTYLALRAGGWWYPTGTKSPSRATWAELVDFMGLGVDEVWTIGPRGGRKKVIG
jgi:hypothetical protein